MSCSDSYWLSEPIPHHYLSRCTPAIHSTQRDGRTVIIGGGLAGVMLAYFLTCHHRCASVVLIEERELCGGSSGRMGGHFWPIGPCSPHRLARSIGLEAAREIYQFGYDAFDDFLRFMHDRPDMRSKIRHVDGKGLDLFAPDILVAEWRSSITRICPVMQARGAKMLDREQIAADYGIHEFETAQVRGKFDGGLYDPNACQLSPVLLAAYLLDLIAKTCTESNGAVTFQCLPKTKVISITRNSGIEPRFQISTHVGDTIGASALVQCTNLICTDLLPLHLCADYDGLTVEPVRDQLIVTEPLAVLSPFTRVGSLCYNSFEAYITRLLSDDGSTCRYLIGGQSDASGSKRLADTQTASHVTSKLKDFIQNVLGVPDIRIDYQFSGTMGISLDLLPVIGQLKRSPGEWVAFGTSPVGMVHLWGLTQALASGMMGASCSKWTLPSPCRLERLLRAL